MLQIKSQLNVSTAEFQSLSSQVEESNQVQNVLGKLVKINALFDSIDKVILLYVCFISFRKLID